MLNVCALVSAGDFGELSLLYVGIPDKERKVVAEHVATDGLGGCHPQSDNYPS